ncbi:hypothetical protein [Devosia sp.]|uniref:hypothetical protein n=1 Tax=Devosia sp. TaxID=1871048 RepID=UPI003267CDC0
MTNQPKRILLSQVNLLWYVPALVVIVALFYLGGSGVFPSWVAVISFFAFFMWLFSLLFALIALARTNKDAGQ